MVKKALSPIVAKLSEWFFIFEAAHAQLSMILLCSSLLCCDFFHETRLLATDSKRNQLPSLVSSARNSFRFLIHSHFHLPMLFSWFFSLFFFFFFFWFYSCCYCRFLHYGLLRNFMPFCGLACCLFLSSTSSAPNTHTFLVCAMK